MKLFRAARAAVAAAATALPLFAAVSGCSSRPAGERAGSTPGGTVAFRPADVGRPPAGFSTALTGGGGPPAWLVRADPSAPGGGPAVVQESADDTSYRFPLCVYDGFEAADASAAVRFKAVSGTVDQAAGVVVRYRPENYYVARANALEDNVNLFKTVDGKRVKLAEVPATVPAGRWHDLGLSVRGTRLTVTLDGKAVIETDDATLAGPGKVGLWTKADSVTAFADLRYGPAR